MCVPCSPQFLADQDDAYMLTRNYFDGRGMNRNFGACIPISDWKRFGFGVGIGEEHHQEQAGTDRMISGLNTNGSSIPVSFTINGPAAVSQRPIVFAEMTSTLMIYAGRVISVIN